MTLAGNRRAEHGGRALCFTVRTPHLDTLFLMTLDTGREIIEHPTSSRPLAVVGQHHGGYCGQCSWKSVESSCGSVPA